MKNYISVEVGRAKISNSDIIAEFGRSNDPINFAKDVAVNDIIFLDKNSPIIDIFVNKQHSGKGTITATENNMSVTVTEVADETGDNLLLAKGHIIELDTKKSADGNFIVNIFVNDHLTAKGIIVVIDGGDFAVRIVEIVSDD